MIKQQTNHKEFYESILQNPERLNAYCTLPMGYMDFKITDGLVEQKITEDSTTQDIIIYAAQQEKRIHDYYSELAEENKDTEIGFIFECFARELLMHKAISVEGLLVFV